MDKKNDKMKKILAFLLIALLISGCESNSGNKSIDEGDVFVVGMECNYPPMRPALRWMNTDGLMWRH